MGFPFLAPHRLSREERVKGLVLSTWFFFTVATLWLLKPIRVSTLLAHLGAKETPYVRLVAVGVVGVVVVLYSIIVSRISRIQLVRWSNLGFALVLALFWLAARLHDGSIVAHRPFVWALYVLVELYSVVIVGVFWTYTNDIVTTAESNRLYGVIGLGGIIGGIAGGAFVDLFARSIGPMNLLLVCAGLSAVCAAGGSAADVILRPPARRSGLDRGPRAALAGAREVAASRYLTLLVALIVGYEFLATMSDFGINVLFERASTNEVELTKMYGRLGWIASITAIVSQVVLVPFLLPSKRVALLLPAVAMVIGAVGALALPVFAMAMVLGVTDRGLNYSIQQATWESLYVPLTVKQKYDAKAFIDMFVDRAAKAIAALVLIALVAMIGVSVRFALGLGLLGGILWIVSARRVARFWKNDEFHDDDDMP